MNPSNFFLKQSCFGAMIFFLFCSFYLVSAQENLDDLYLRKAVKNFVGKNYDDAIANLDQVLTIDTSNTKARKLLAKCYERKGNQELTQNQLSSAETLLRKALEYDPTNAEATAALLQVQSTNQAALRANISQSSSAATQSVPLQQPQQSYSPLQATPVIINQQVSGNDSSQTKVVTSLLKNFEKQQDLMAQQIVSNNQMLTQSGDQKDQYLKALVGSMEQKNKLMQNFMIIGGGVVLGIVVLVLVIFVFVFKWYAHSSELRTIQATETITALLAAPQHAPLMISAPGVASANTGQATAVEVSPSSTIAFETLNTSDPVQRAKAVEAVAAEIVTVENTDRAKKIKKLEEMLKDENNRVRANAAKALYEINPVASIQTLNDMLQSDSNRMRASATWALGEIGTSESLMLIFTLDGEQDEIVKYNIKMALEKIKSQKKISVTDDLNEKIESRLVQYADIS